MAKSWTIYGVGSVVLLIQVGCGREPSAAKPQASRTGMTDSAVLESKPAPPPVVESNPGETPMANDVTDDGSPIAADLKRLADPVTTPEEWESCQTRILQQGAQAVPVLASGLTSDDPLERETAAMLLAAIGEGLEQAEQPLRAALRDESTFVRANAATALCQLPETEDAVIPVLAELLASSDPTLRQIAATNLGNFGPEAAPFVDRLAGTLEDERPEVLMPVVELLGRIGPAAEAAAPKLRQIAFEQSGEVQAAATAALEQIGQESVQ
jgi:HEAT repeat protein